MPGTFDAAAAARAMEWFARSLDAHRVEIDSLNVYPVPDGDTGTNLAFTQRAVVSAIADERPAGLVDLGSVVGRASLMAARGNSGVILSQVLRGLFAGWAGGEAVDGSALVSGLEEATRQAYQAVARPVEGTALSVLRDAAGAASAAREEGGDLGRVLGAAVEEARASLARTTDALPELRAAGVVDAGAKGIVLLLETLRAVLDGTEVAEPPGPLGPVVPGHDVPRPVVLAMPFEVQLLLEAPPEEVAPLRARLAAIGESVVVVGGSGLVNVHVHTDEPERALKLARSVGAVHEPRVTDLRQEVVACLAGAARSVRVAEQACGLVAVADGAGLLEAFRSLGAAVVIGGPDRVPPAEDLVAAIEATPAPEVVILPNDAAVEGSCRTAADASAKEVTVLAVRSIPAGLAAATEFNPMAALRPNRAAMDEAAGRCRAGHLARADADADTPAGHVEAGEWVATADREPVAVGGLAAECALAVVRHLAPPDAELVTLVVGAGAGAEDRRTVEAALRRALPDAELHVIRGLQPGRPFLIGVE
jgi:DAK2 domain fusion protein YloV